jgi:hypothetical protein
MPKGQINLTQILLHMPYNPFRFGNRLGPLASVTQIRSDYIIGANPDIVPWCEKLIVVVDEDLAKGSDIFKDGRLMINFTYRGVLR